MTTDCPLPTDLLHLVSEMAWGVRTKKHLFVDIQQVLAYRCAIPDIFLSKFVPRLSKLPENDHGLGVRMMTNHYDQSYGFSPLVSEAFEGNPYRSDQPYVPSNDIPETGIWSNVLWFLVDMMTSETFAKFRFYRAPNTKRLRKLWCGPISNWNLILAAIQPWQEALEDVDNFCELELWQASWPSHVAEQIPDARFAEIYEPNQKGDCLSWLSPQLKTSMMRQSRRALY